MLFFHKLRISRSLKGNIVKTKNGEDYIIFRQIIKYPVFHEKSDCIFIVRFKFRHLSHKQNKIASVIPMLLIAGHPGFKAKIYSVNPNNGYWQGIYVWKSQIFLDIYKKSFVFGMMNKRAIPETIKIVEPIENSLKNLF
ncbi:MAG: hypothetical protein JXR31_07020 [Prolixibacteraceae bacterium]|nr:hypothetical protein [Prolixibacteraceae bacterium]